MTLTTSIASAFRVFVDDSEDVDRGFGETTVAVHLVAHREGDGRRRRGFGGGLAGGVVVGDAASADRAGSGGWEEWVDNLAARLAYARGRDGLQCAALPVAAAAALEAHASARAVFDLKSPHWQIWCGGRWGRARRTGGGRRGELRESFGVRCCSLGRILWRAGRSRGTGWSGGRTRMIRVIRRLSTGGGRRRRRRRRREGLEEARSAKVGRRARVQGRVAR